MAGGKAVGEDGIPSDLLRAAPLEMAKVLHPLIIKALIYGYEPFAWRGGQVLQVLKSAPDPT
eukprot:10570450-Alexandrium_andersonii.AAC.1